jgi:translation elongation factor EF-Tu-like GTPase
MSFHFQVRDIFDIAGRGIVVLGTIESGSVRIGDTLQLACSSSKRAVVVASIEKFKHPALHEAGAGPEDVAIGLFGVSREQIHVHDILTSIV